MRYIFWLIILLILPAVQMGCSIDDEDRCIEGYSWDNRNQMCYQCPLNTQWNTATRNCIDPNQPIDTDTVDTDTVQGFDSDSSSDSSSIPDYEQIGLGLECYHDTDCAEFEADFCQSDDRYPDQPGACTIQGCVVEDCVEPFSCCDCEASDWVREAISEPICVHNDNKGELENYGCTCE